MVLAETFEHAIFRQSLGRLFERDASGHLRMAFNATVEVTTRVRGSNRCACQHICERPTLFALHLSSYRTV